MIWNDRRGHGLLGFIGELMSWRHESVPVDSRKMGVTQEMRIEWVDRPTTPRVWTVAVCPADPLCTFAFPAPCYEAHVCCIPQTPLPTGFLLGSAPGRPGWIDGETRVIFISPDPSLRAAGGQVLQVSAEDHSSSSCGSTPGEG